MKVGGYMFNLNDKNFIGYKICIPLFIIISITLLFAIGIKYIGTQYQNTLLTLAFFSQSLAMILSGIKSIKTEQGKNGYIVIILSVILIAFILYFYIFKLSYRSLISS